MTRPWNNCIYQSYINGVGWFNRFMKGVKTRKPLIFPYRGLLVDDGLWRWLVVLKRERVHVFLWSADPMTTDSHCGGAHSFLLRGSLVSAPPCSIHPSYHILGSNCVCVCFFFFLCLPSLTKTLAAEEKKKAWKKMWHDFCLFFPMVAFSWYHSNTRANPP